jgi:molybdopterin/thiamine biosynthesis adenylyltransferase
MERLDRQLRIKGWNQSALNKARIAVVGDDDLMASLFMLSASALGINQLLVIAPVLNSRLLHVARQVNSDLNLIHLEGYYTHPILDDLFRGCSLFVDLSHYGLANKLLLEKGFRKAIPVVRGFCYEREGVQGFKVFTYLRGREWQELDQVVSPNNLPGSHFDDGVLDTIVAGIVLEEVKSLLMQQRISAALVGYERGALRRGNPRSRILVVGAGALGNFVGLGLALSGYRRCTFMDPDVVEATNLNRQVFFYDALGRSKAETLSERMNGLFGMESGAVAGYFQENTDLSPYDVVFDCVDNFETRIVLSEVCREQGKVLISGGTSADAGQAVVFDPAKPGPTPAELLGLPEIVRERGAESVLRDRAACTYRPDPSVIMTNQITAGFMVDSFRMMQGGQDARNIFYNSSSDERF